MQGRNKAGYLLGIFCCCSSLGALEGPILDVSSMAPADGLTITGIAFGETELSFRFVAVGAGDLNDDGFDDLAIAHETVTEARVYILYGSDQPFPSSFDIESIDATKGIVLRAPVQQYYNYPFGLAAIGDTNGDGVDDLLIGRVGMHTTAFAAGSAFVIYGKAGGLSSDIDLTLLDGSEGSVFPGTTGFESIARNVGAAGDVNNDGYADFFIGTGRIGDDPLSEGGTYLIFGSPTGYGAEFDFSTIDGSNGTLMLGANDHDRFALDFAGGGDINGDGIDDMVFGAAGESDVPAYTSRSYAVFGHTDGFSATTQISALDNNDRWIINARYGFNFGNAITTGDFNGDGLFDIAIGDDQYGNPGSVQLIFGDATPKTAPVEVSDYFFSEADGELRGHALMAHAGSAVDFIGDINGDGFSDLIVDGFDQASESGRASVVFGSDQPFDDVKDLGQLNGFDGFAVSGFGSPLNVQYEVSRAGDLNGDGFADFVISGGSFGTGGVAFVVFGRNAKPSVASIDAQSIPANTELQLPVILGDVETSPTDVVVSVVSDDGALLPQSGIALTGTGTTRTLTLTPQINTIGDVTVTVSIADEIGQTYQEEFVLSVTILDADDDGVADWDDAFPNDAAESADTDSDGVGDNADVFPNDPSETIDTDNDGTGNNADTDDDEDGVLDVDDAFPLDADETTDTDLDGIGNNADEDDDNDGIDDAWEIRFGLDSLDASNSGDDPDQDGLTTWEEYLLGSNPISQDTDGDLVGDAEDTCLLLADPEQVDQDQNGIGDSCDPSFFRQVVLVGSSDNSSESLVAAAVPYSSGIKVQLSDLSTAAAVSELSFFNAAWQGKSLLSWTDTESGEALIAAAGTDTSGVLAIQIKHARTGVFIKNLFPLNSNWEMMDALVIGNAEIATLAKRKSDGLIAVELRNIETGILRRISYPLSSAWEPKGMVLANVDDEVMTAILAERKSDGLTVVQVRDPRADTVVKNVYPLGFGWRALEIQELPDLDNNGASELGTRMVRDDGLEVIQIRDAKTNDLVSNVYPLGAGFSVWSTRTFQSLEMGGQKYLGILSSHRQSGQMLVQIKHVLDGSLVRNNYFIGPPWYYESNMTVFSEVDSDNIGVLARNPSSGLRLLQVRDAETGALVLNYFQPTDY